METFERKNTHKIVARPGINARNAHPLGVMETSNVLPSMLLVLHVGPTVISEELKYARRRGKARTLGE